MPSLISLLTLAAAAATVVAEAQYSCPADSGKTAVVRVSSGLHSYLPV